MQIRLPFVLLTSATRNKFLSVAFRSSSRRTHHTVVSMTASNVLNRITPDQVSMEIKDPVDAKALEIAKSIMKELVVGTTVGEKPLMTVAQRLGDIPQDASTYLVSKEECKEAFDGLTDVERTALVNIHGRVKAFAEMQRKSVSDMEMDIPGGRAGHTVSPCKGKYPTSL